ncbi:hypothetical protein ACLK19_16045 [Escherichia coli]
MMEQPVKATTWTLYDLALNTKMYAMQLRRKLMSEGRILTIGSRKISRLPIVQMTPSKAKTRCGFLTCCITAGDFPADHNIRIKRSRRVILPNKGQTLEMISDAAGVSARQQAYLQ